MTEAQNNSERIKLMGKRGSYSLVRNGNVICTGSNRERLRGVQYFLESNPAYRSAPELLEALKGAAEDVCGLSCPAVWCTADGQPHSDRCKVVNAAIAKATGQAA